MGYVWGTEVGGRPDPERKGVGSLDTEKGRDVEEGVRCFTSETTRSIT